MKFYLVAMLFILFDVEAVFIYPWAIILRDLKRFGLWEMLVYIGVFLVGFFYVWKKGVLDWGERTPSDRPEANDANAAASRHHRCGTTEEPPRRCARLLGVESEAVTGVKFDRDEMTIYVERADIREACVLLKEDPACPFNFLLRPYLCGLVSGGAAV